MKIPKFRSEDQERNYWAKVDLSKHFAASDFEEAAFPDLKPTTQAISIRIPNYLIVLLKEKANALRIPYQSLIKTFIRDGLATN